MDQVTDARGCTSASFGNSEVRRQPTTAVFWTPVCFAPNLALWFGLLPALGSLGARHFGRKLVQSHLGR